MRIVRVIHKTTFRIVYLPRRHEGRITAGRPQMSAEATRWAWAQALKPTAKLVLLALSDRARDTGECWPSVARLCLNTGLNRKTVMGCAAELEKIGLLTIIKKNGSGNKYQLKITEETSTENSTGSTNDIETQPVPKTALPSTKNGTATSTTFGTQNLKEEPINNLSIKTFVKTEDETHVDSVADIFKFWQTTMNHPSAVFDTKRKSIISKALKNYTPDQLKAAVTGCAKSAFHMGQNDQRKIYDGLDLIFRNAEKIEGFIQSSTITPTTGAGNHATKHQQSTSITQQIFGAAARVYAAASESVGGNGHLVSEDDRYLPKTLG